MPDADRDYYWRLGRMICRAAEAEVMIESLARELHPELDDAWFSARNAEAVAKAVTRAADRWAGQTDQIRDLVTVMRDGADVRNWLVHAWVLSPVQGDWVELQKPVKQSTRWGRRRIYFDEVDMLASRFGWVLKAITRVVNERDWEVQRQPTYFADPLGPPPPLPDLVELSVARTE